MIWVWFNKLFCVILLLLNLIMVIFFNVKIIFFLVEVDLMVVVNVDSCRRKIVVMIFMRRGDFLYILEVYV